MTSSALVFDVQVILLEFINCVGFHMFALWAFEEERFLEWISIAGLSHSHNRHAILLILCNNGNCGIPFDFTI